VERLRAHVTQSMEGIAQAATPVLLDIDVYRDVPLDEAVSAETLREWAEKMRRMKNAIFFGSITDRAAALYTK